MTMQPGEIAIEYKQAKNKLKQVNILAELNQCPKAEIISRELVDKFKAQGYSVRAWGVKNEELMRRVIDSGADGMTVNFPDKLTEALK